MKRGRKPKNTKQHSKEYENKLLPPNFSNDELDGSAITFDEAKGLTEITRKKMIQETVSEFINEINTFLIIRNKDIEAAIKMDTFSYLPKAGYLFSFFRDKKAFLRQWGIYGDVMRTIMEIYKKKGLEISFHEDSSQIFIAINK